MGGFRNDRRRQRFNDVAEVGVWEMLAQGTNRGRREDNVANLAQANQKDPFIQLPNYSITQSPDLGLDRGLIDQHDGDVVFNGVYAFARRALQC